MPPPRTLVLVLAGGAGSRLELLTEKRAKPVVPFGGEHRLIDIPLSNVRHSGLSDVWVVQQQHPASLGDALANGRPWDLDRSTGGLLLLPPAQGGSREGWHHGTADALWKQAALVREFAPDALVVLSADAVYRCDYAELVAEHLESGAAVTMLTTRVPREEADRYGVVVTEGERVTRYEYKPDDPPSDQVVTEVFAMDPGRVLGELEALVEAGIEGEELGDLGDHLLPRLVGSGEARARRLRGYWRDVGTVEAYWEAHMDLLGEEPAFTLDDDAWPVLSSGARRSAARVRAGARVQDSLLSGGCDVGGRVERSVVAPGAVVEPGAVVRGSVLLPGVVVRAGARVERTVVDSAARIGEDCRIGGSRGEVALVGGRRTVRRGTVVPAGGRWPRSAEADKPRSDD